MKKRGRPKGRPVVLTPEIQSDFCRYIQAGNYIETAAKIVGVSKASVYSWLDQGNKERKRREKGNMAQKKNDKYISFLDAVKKAEGEAEARDVALIARAATEQWQAAAWRLERKHYHRWGRRQLLEHSGPDGGAVEVQVIKIGDKEIKF